MGGGCNEQIHYPSARLAPDLRRRRGQLPIAAGNGLVHCKWIEEALDKRQSAQPLGPPGIVARYEHTEVQFRERCRADRKVTVERRHVGRNDNAGVQHRSHSEHQGSRGCPSRRFRSSVHNSSAGPVKSSRTSA